MAISIFGDDFFLQLKVWLASWAWSVVAAGFSPNVDNYQFSNVFR